MALPRYAHEESADERMVAAAAAVLQRRLAGESLRKAVLAVSANHALSQAEVGRSWARRKREALSTLTMGRVVDACPWSEGEVARLARIFRGQLTYTPGSAEDVRAGC